MQVNDGLDRRHLLAESGCLRLCCGPSTAPVRRSADPKKGDIAGRQVSCKVEQPNQPPPDVYTASSVASTTVP